MSLSHQCDHVSQTEQQFIDADMHIGRAVYNDSKSLVTDTPAALPVCEAGGPCHKKLGARVWTYDDLSEYIVQGEVLPGHTYKYLAYASFACVESDDLVIAADIPWSIRKDKCKCLGIWHIVMQ